MKFLLALIAAFCVMEVSATPQESDPRSMNIASILDAARDVRMQNVRRMSSVSGEGGKCGLWISLAILRNWDKFSDAQRIELGSFLQAPQTQRERVIGRFRIHYDTTGASAATMLDANNGYIPVPNSSEEYVDSVGAIFNDVYETETGVLGYDSPFQPGQTLYDITVSNISYYGLTHSESPIGGFFPPRYLTSIEIDNDYRQFFSRGMAGLKVTAAHEFHHAIQLSSYGLWPSDAYFLEITSTWMEDVIYDDVNDYYQYIEGPPGPGNPNEPAPRGQFATPEVTFTQSNGLIEYSRAIWGKFLEQRYSADIMRRTWEEIRQVPALTALDRALAQQRQSSLRQEFAAWTIWNYHTGVLADTIREYREGNHYPKINTRAPIWYTPPSRSVSENIGAFSSVYLPIIVGTNQMIAIISNVNPQLPSGPQYFSYVMQDQGGASLKHLANGIFVRIDVPDPEDWISQESVPSLVTEAVVYPNPFIWGKSPMIVIRLPFVSDKTASLVVLSMGLERVFSGERPVSELRPLEQSIEWNVKNDAGDRVVSGIYIFVVSIDGKEFRGKCTVIGG